jgi:hypothetical protein
LLKDKKLALELNKQYFAFTEEHKQQMAPLELDEKRLFTLQKNNLVPADLSWLATLDNIGIFLTHY